MAIFFSAATAAGAFGGLLARAIMELDGARGISAWSWIFIIEGAVTVLLGKLTVAFGVHTGICVAAYPSFTCPILHIIDLHANSPTALVAFWAMYDYADTATFLTAREREEISRRLAADRLYLDDKFSLKYFWHAVADWKI
jgi:MFS family permease